MVTSTSNNNNSFSSKVCQKMLCLPLFIFTVFVLSFPVAEATPEAGEVNVITEIERVLAGQKQLNKVVEYLKLSKTEILQALNKTQTESFTFFAPTDWAFISALPQDIFNPFYKDAQLRETVLLHHFVRGALTKEDLLKLTEVVMADQKTSTLSANATTETVEINGAKIELTPISLGSNLGVVYIVDRIFTTHEEISNAIQRHPSSHTPWGPIPPEINSAQIVERQTILFYGLSLFTSLIYAIHM